MVNQPNTKFDEAFTALVEGFDRSVPCAQSNKDGSSCKRPAIWHVNVHGCADATLCGPHFRKWEGENIGMLARSGAVSCRSCSGRWTVGRGSAWTAVRI